MASARETPSDLQRLSGGSPRKVCEMYSDTWFPERLVSDRWVNSRLSMRLNCGAREEDERGGWRAGRTITGKDSKQGGFVSREGDEQGGWQAGALCPHLVGGHLAHRATSLQCLQLLQAPVQLLQCLLQQLHPRVLWEPGGLGQGSPLGACAAPISAPQPLEPRATAPHLLRVAVSQPSLVCIGGWGGGVSANVGLGLEPVYNKPRFKGSMGGLSQLPSG